MKGKIVGADNKIIELFDKGTTLIQKRGLLPLNTLIMGTECLFWSVLVARSINDNGMGKYIITAAGAICITAAFLRWKDAHQYWENHRKTQELNAKVLLERDYIMLRMIAILIFMPILIVEVLVLDLLGGTSSIAIIVLGY